jgi:ubiquitin C-terminal hydrolase
LFNDDNKKTIYHLYAINECVHSKISSHYICHIKLENKWFLFDDDKRVEEESELDDAKSMKSSSVVGLFYKREI